MPRNLITRVETLFPVEDEGLIRHVGDVVLEIYLQDDIEVRHAGRRELRLSSAPE